MVAAAVASCISLMLVQEMAKAGLKDEYVKTESQLSLEQKKGRWEITGIELNVTASVPTVHAKKFQRAVEIAKTRCPISRALNVPIKVTAKAELEAHTTAA